MKFGPVPVSEAVDTILAHSVQVGKSRLKKGLRLDPESISKLVESGVETVIVARLDPSDIDEDAAAAALAEAFRGPGISCGIPATGRVNLFADTAGLFRADRQKIDHFNLIDPAITFACVADASVVAAGDMVATIKIIPLAVECAALATACEIISDAGFARVQPFRPHRVGVIATRLPTLKPSVMEKTRQLTRTRLEGYGSSLTGYRECAHDAESLAESIMEISPGHEMVLIFGASAVIDPDDVIPAAIRKAGGRVERVGMPVDPGNLLVLGELEGMPVLGAPGCARSPKENGFDWVLARILADDPPTTIDIAGMGVGGLLMEISTRPQPRANPEKQTRTGVGIVLLAAGRASRMGEGAGHKLLADFDGIPLVRRMAERARASTASKVVVVTGYRNGEITKALDGLQIDLIENPDFATGMASSLKTGVRALGPDVAGIMVLLADMPAVTSTHLDTLISAFSENEGAAIIRASDGDHRGNPVILPVALMPDINKLEGDVGARALIESSGYPVIDMDIGASARLDVDTPDAVIAAGGDLEPGRR